MSNDKAKSDNFDAGPPLQFATIEEIEAELARRFEVYVLACATRSAAETRLTCNPPRNAFGGDIRLAALCASGLLSWIQQGGPQL